MLLLLPIMWVMAVCFASGVTRLYFDAKMVDLPARSKGWRISLVSLISGTLFCVVFLIVNSIYAYTGIYALTGALAGGLTILVGNLAYWLAGKLATTPLTGSNAGNKPAWNNLGMPTNSGSFPGNANVPPYSNVGIPPYGSAGTQFHNANMPPYSNAGSGMQSYSNVGAAGAQPHNYNNYNDVQSHANEGGQQQNNMGAQPQNNTGGQYPNNAQYPNNMGGQSYNNVNVQPGNSGVYPQNTNGYSPAGNLQPQNINGYPPTGVAQPQSASSPVGNVQQQNQQNPGGNPPVSSSAAQQSQNTSGYPPVSNEQPQNQNLNGNSAADNLDAANPQAQSNLNGNPGSNSDSDSNSGGA